MKDDSQPGGRVIGFDLLRGLCAVAVAAYHMTYWAKLAELHAFELYGVYTFFILSGASMTIAYSNRLHDGYPISKYLGHRFFRLAPLYFAVASTMAVAHLRDHGVSPTLATRYLLNVTFLMGFANPGETSLVVGGWSLGVEFVFYLMFPLAAAIANERWFRWVALALFASQLLFVNHILASADLEQAWVQYTQFASFMGYFAAGMFIGTAVNRGVLVQSRRTVWLAWLALAVALAALGAPTARETLVGHRGAGLAIIAIALVTVSALLPLRGLGRQVASSLGDASYPMYLLHPLVFSFMHSRYGAPDFARSSPRLFVAVAMSASLGISVLVWRWFERPILAWAKRKLR